MATRKKTTTTSSIDTVAKDSVPDSATEEVTADTSSSSLDIEVEADVTVGDDTIDGAVAVTAGTDESPTVTTASGRDYTYRKGVRWYCPICGQEKHHDYMVNRDICPVDDVDCPRSKK